MLQGTSARLSQLGLIVEKHWELMAVLTAGAIQGGGVTRLYATRLFNVNVIKRHRQRHVSYLDHYSMQATVSALVAA